VGPAGRADCAGVPKGEGAAARRWGSIGCCAFTACSTGSTFRCVATLQIQVVMTPTRAASNQRVSRHATLDQVGMQRKSWTPVHRLGGAYGVGRHDPARQDAALIALPVALALRTSSAAMNTRDGWSCRGAVLGRGTGARGSESADMDGGHVSVCIPAAEARPRKIASDLIPLLSPLPSWPLKRACVFADYSPVRCRAFGVAW